MRYAVVKMNKAAAMPPFFRVNHTRVNAPGTARSP